MQDLIQVITLVTCVTGKDFSTNEPVPIYSDTCDYHAYDRCGDQCILNYKRGGGCYCGSSSFHVNFWKEQCCIASEERCISEDSGETNSEGDVIYDGVCSEGEIKPISSKCNNTDRTLQCYNSYQDSRFVNSDSHYTCPHTCVSLYKDMCRGVSWCGSDVQECGPQLICAGDKTSDDHYDIINNLNFSLAPEHHYCEGSLVSKTNNGLYELIDRSDETQANSAEGTSYDIDPDQFPACKLSDGSPGVMCGSICYSSSLWCPQDHTFGIHQCEVISEFDRRLCGNPLVFSNV